MKRFWKWFKDRFKLEYVKPYVKPPNEEGQWDSNNDGNLDIEDIEKQAQRAEYGIEFRWRF